MRSKGALAAAMLPEHDTLKLIHHHHSRKASETSSPARRS
jgi:hypothetical protein